MASVESHSTGKRRLIRPDMTAMVDVAFLLLMFFVLTASVVKPRSMQLILPVEGKQSVNCGKVLTIYLAADDQVYLAGGCNPTPVLTGWGSGELRQALLNAKQNTQDLIVVLKPTRASRYQNLVDALDEFTIAGLSKYAVGEMTELDEQLFIDNRIQLY